ncbi:MAG TPA: hypothetical protein VM008_07140 [Phycisphaerae bacterium]|nr:hypothetical protein [Phycisphaerae bacterium]
MGSAPTSPRVQKGALIGFDAANPLASVVVFQYNPETVTRTLAAQTAGTPPPHSTTAPSDAQRLIGPPNETIKLDVVIDATDQLEKGDATATSVGIYPQLSALEMLLYPKSTLVIANEVLLRAGVIEVIPAEAPLAILVWGPKRVLPVRVNEFSITEEMFDPNLNPIQAKVSLSMRVLNYRDLGLLSVGGGLFMAHQMAKEGLATLNGANNIGPIASAIGV